MTEPNTELDLPQQAWLLGIAGLMPFISLPLLIAIDVLSFSQGAFYFKQYSAVILSFLGGVLWLNALMERHTSHMLYIAMLPSIFGWLGICFMPTQAAITLLTICFVSLLFYERKFLLLPQAWIIAYSKLRYWLTAVVTMSHFIMILVD